ncbi:cadherin EGF LAG seven-pass G-type receptor 2-like, partial [Ruditapes philippinarum]|uniref:cadherin EGF LAG seven-pass G-type receptor 2-like n=1 Tax=Ruditapes philippinarum TaxID=129788 RepID=UPI00295A96EF
MTILIEDINDNTPVFEKSNYKAVVSESSPIGFTLATVKATDSDGTFPNNEVVYTFTGGNTNDAFRIDSTTGNIAIAKQLDGYNITPQYELIILGVDGGTDPSPLTGTTTMLVKIFDETSLTTTMSAEIVTQQETLVQRDHIFTIGYFSGFG